MLKPFLTVPVCLVAGALLLLYGPTTWELAHGLWQLDAHSHGPVVLAVSVWLFIRGLVAHDREGALPEPKRLAGALVFGFGLLTYALGRSQSVAALEVGSAIPVVMGVVLLTRGPALARRLWFAFVFLLFLVPLPGSLVDAITQPMKLGVSWAVESLLYAMGYPIGRSGVVLGIGSYRLFVADACAGLNSLFMLEAFGLLYLNVVRHESPLRNAALAVLIVPISFISNVVRVAILALVTYHFGDEAGQGFVHGFSGLVLFVVALLLTIAADVGVRAAVSSWRPAVAEPRPDPLATTNRAAVAEPIPLNDLPFQSNAATGLGLLTAAAIAAWATWVITLSPLAPAAAPDLEAAIPVEFGDWKRVDLPVLTVDVAPRGGAKGTDRPYDGVLMRAYKNSSGQTVALAVAYAAEQRQETKIHRPAECYKAQGFSLINETSTDFLLPWSISIKSRSMVALRQSGAKSLLGKRLHVKGVNSEQAVSYIIRVGDDFPQSGWELRKAVFLNNLFHRSTDGLLLRASSVTRSEEADASYALNEQLLFDLLVALPESAHRLLLGTESVASAHNQGLQNKSN